MNFPFFLRRHRRRAFTVLDMMLVVVVLGILTSLAIISFQRVQERAYQAAMKNDLRNFATAREIYVSEAGDYPATVPEVSEHAFTPRVYEASYQNEGLEWALLVGHEKTETKCVISTYETGGGAHRIYCHADATLPYDVVVNDAELTATFDATRGVGQIAFTDGSRMSLGALLAAPREEIGIIAWEYGDGTRSSGSPETHLVQSHAYTKSGEYQTSMTVVKKGGVIGRGKKMVTVGAPGKTEPTNTAFLDPRLAECFAVSPVEPVPTETATLSAPTHDKQGRPLTAWRWDLQSLGSATGQIHSQVFPEMGIYWIHLYTTDADGEELRCTKDVTVRYPDGPPIGKASEVPMAGSPVTFNAGSVLPEGKTAADVTSVKWNFGPGTHTTGGGSAGLVTDYTFVEPGSYNVTATLTFADGTTAMGVVQSFVIEPAYRGQVYGPGPSLASGWGNSGTEVYGYAARFSTGGFLERTFPVSDLYEWGGSVEKGTQVTLSDAFQVYEVKEVTPTGRVYTYRMRVRARPGSVGKTLNMGMRISQGQVYIKVGLAYVPGYAASYGTATDWVEFDRIEVLFHNGDLTHVSQGLRYAPSARPLATRPTSFDAMGLIDPYQGQLSITRVDWNFGNGVSESIAGSGGIFKHYTYPAAGTFTVFAQATYKDGTVIASEVPITVGAPPAASTLQGPGPELFNWYQYSSSRMRSFSEIFPAENSSIIREITSADLSAWSGVLTDSRHITLSGEHQEHRFTVTTPTGRTYTLRFRARGTGASVGKTLNAGLRVQSTGIRAVIGRDRAFDPVAPLGTASDWVEFDEIEISYTNPSPQAKFTYSATDKTVAFDASTSTDPMGGGLTYTWDFGDWTSGSGVNPTHTYASNIEYSVKLTVKDVEGKTSSVTKAVDLSVPTQGLLRWYRADKLALAEGQAVSSWTDQSSNAKHATQSASSNQPVYRAAGLNGRPSVQFAAAQAHHLAMPRLDVGDFTVFVVQQTAGSVIFLGTSSETVGNFQVRLLSDDRMHLYTMTNASGASSDLPPVARTTPSILSYVRDGTAGWASFYQNGTAIGLNRPLSGGGMSFDRISSVFGHHWIEGHVGEIIIYNRKLSDTERAQVEAGLKSRYGL